MIALVYNFLQLIVLKNVCDFNLNVTDNLELFLFVYFKTVNILSLENLKYLKGKDKFIWTLLLEKKTNVRV